MSETHVLEKRAIDRQNRAWKSMQDIKERAAAENRDMTAEERSAWDEAEREVDTAGGDIERFQRERKLDSVDRDDVVTTGGGEERSKSDVEKRYEDAFRRYLSRGVEGLDPEQRQILAQPHQELRALGTTADNIGGYLVPEGFRNKLVETMKAYGGLSEMCDHITTETGNALPWVTNDDTGNEGEILGENQQVGEQDLAFGGRELGSAIFSSKMTKVPVTLLQDSAFDLWNWLPGKLGERIGRRAARAWITGTGVKQPEGITTNAPVGKLGANGQTTSITYADLIDLEHSMDPAYRNNGARFILSDNLLKVIRKLMDGQNRPLWVPVPATGMPATINGIPYTVENSMPVPAANAISLLFCNPKAAYIIRTILGVQTLRLTERYAEMLQVGFLSYARMDGMVQDPNAVRAYKHSAV